MKRIGQIILILWFLSMILAGCAGQGKLAIEDPWARPANAGDNSAAYFTIDNPTSSADVLRSASGTVAASLEVHMSKMENGVMKMQPQESVEVPAKNKVNFQPGGLHIMLVNLKQDLKPGDRFDLTLQFDKAGAQTIQVTVKDQ